MRDSNIRSLAKAVSWRVTGTVDTFIISWFITGQPLLATGIALTEIITKVFLFWVHERAWNKINWGRADVVPTVKNAND
jgi:uncharacterized membrane protein